MPSAAVNWPYIILAPDYKESSLGVQVIHRLCHLLNESGQLAYLKQCVVNPDWNTPCVSFDDFREYTEGGKPFIAVYPEVIAGNPLNAPVVVRYMLNREGVIEHRSMNARAEDLYFWYREEFADKAFNAPLLALESYDLSLFCDDNAEKDLDLLYVNRMPVKKIDFSKLPTGIRVLSMQQPLSLNELAAVLKRGRVLYTFESSGTCTLANLCGCPVVALTQPGYEQLAINEQTVRDNGGGIAWNDHPQDLARTRLSLSTVRDGMLAKRALTDRQLNVFITQTQQRAEEMGQFLPTSTVDSWLELRRMSSGQREQVAAKIEALHQPARMMIVVRNSSETQDLLDITLRSLTQSRLRYPHIKVLLTSKSFSHDPLPDWVTVMTDEYQIQLMEEQWVQVIDAGTRLLADSFCKLGLILSENSGCFAVFTDELIERKNGELETALRPDFNLDLVLSTPWLYARRWLFHSDALNSISPELPVNTIAWELEVITRLVEQRDISGIGHVSEPLLVVPSSLLKADDIEAVVIQRHLEQRGYPQAQVTFNDDKPWRLSYGNTSLLAVSVIILAGDDLNYLQRCVELMVGKTTHETYEIIIVHQAGGDEILTGWLNNVIRGSSEKIVVVTLETGTAVAAMYNAGAKAARGDFILLFNTRAIVVQNNWLTNLLNHAQRPEVGSVGGKIISLDQRVLTAGEIIGGNDFCLPIGYGSTIDMPGYMQRLQSDQNLTVLNLACLMIKKEAWQAVGGMDEGLVTLKQVNIDLSLKLRQAGYMSVWTPYSVVASDELHLHPRSKTLTEAEEQGDKTIRSKWLPLLLRDPAYNDNFSSQRQLFKPEMHPAMIENPVAERIHHRVLALSMPAGTGAPEYFAAAVDDLQRKGVIGGVVTENHLDFRLFNRVDADAFVISSDLPLEARDLILSLRKRQHSVFSQMVSLQWMTSQTRQSPDLRGIDRLIVQNEAQAESARQYNRPVVILPRSLLAVAPYAKSARHEGKKLHVLCNTCELSEADIELIHNLIRELADEVSWQVLGPLPSLWIPWIDEHYRYPGHHYYLPLLASIDTDLAIIPRADNKFNRLKDSFSLMELAACGIPALVSDVVSLHSHVPARRVRNRKTDWLEAVRQAMDDRVGLEIQGRSATHSLRETDWLFGETIDQHLRAWLA